MATKRTKKDGDAIALLKADHDKVKKMFKQFEKLHEDEAEDEAEQLAKQICNELKVHTAIEEEIFYPEVREAIDDEDLMNEAEVEHAGAKQLITEIEAMSASDEMFAAKVTVLGENIDHHVKEEHEEMFPKAQKTKLDMEELGARMLERKHELMSELGMEDEEKSEEKETPRRSGAHSSRASHTRR